MAIQSELKTRMVRRMGIWRCAASVVLAALLVAMAEPGVPNTGAQDPVAEKADPPHNGQMIGTGKVQFTTTRDGKWLALTPEWSGQSLISLGGFVLYAADADGRMTERVNTARGGVRVAKNASALEKCSEGMVGGFRAPSPDPDDDRDGVVDEDWLDGEDNDKDGRVDEDFAAIGDQMIATSFYAPDLSGDDAGKPGLVFQQEAYAWSLPHIDGAVMLSLRVTNVGKDDLQNVRIGAFFEKRGQFAFLSQSVDPPKSSSTTERSQMVVCEDAAGMAVGLVAFPMVNVVDPWFVGHVAGEAWNDALAGRLETKSGVTAAAADNENTGIDRLEIEAGAVVYAVSPVIDTLSPGGAVRIDLALVVADGGDAIAATAANAYETYIGDGVNRYLPPPVSMTPRVIWGLYSPAAAESGIEGVYVDIEPLGDTPVSPDNISYFSGLGPGAVVRREVQPGVEKLMIRGEAVEQLALNNERIVLKGRLENGEFFELILRPQEGASVGVSRDVSGGMEAELYWKTAGRLEQHLLTSSPNPFRDVTSISYEVPSLIEKDDGTLIRSSESLETSVKVYNVMGRLVSVLVEEILGPGTRAVNWRAVDDNGNPVASGVYYVKLQIGQKYITKRLILLK
ncbi:MAG: T9SS type A sorting domain-containing protein [Candidatus Latescibacterota bacterium]|nr:MAG: T9SS type A sorting domain-containing protein [Candidatus Latescibacterota bacterium]